MLSLERNGYTAAQVLAALYTHRTESFRYELLDSTNNVKSSLYTVLSASVANNALDEIKRTAKFTILDDGSINYLSDRIRPYAQLRMPDGGWIEFALGVFLLTSPKRAANATGVVTRDIEAYDQLQILRDDSFEDRFTVKAGDRVVDKVSSVLTSAGIRWQNLTASDKTFPADQDWEPETTKLQIINDMLAAINYRSLFFDEIGYAVAMPYVTPDVRTSEHTYINDGKSVLLPGVEQELDLFSVPNKWILYVSNPEQTALRSVYTNTSPASSTSTVSRGRTIVARKQVDAVDQAALDGLARREAFDASQVYEKVTFETALMPFHADSDVYTLVYDKLGLNAKYSETSWAMDLKPGARMKHEARRVVSV